MLHYPNIFAHKNHGVLWSLWAYVTVYKNVFYYFWGLVFKKEQHQITKNKFINAQTSAGVIWLPVARKLFFHLQKKFLYLTFLDRMLEQIIKV